MARIKILSRNINPLPERIRSSAKPARMAGRKLQDKRLELWLKDPHCARCGCGVGFPNGFELDHIMPLFKGGEDIDENRQILCVNRGDIEGCHSIKTAEDIER